MTKLVAFSPAASTDLNSYITNQLQVISQVFPDLEIEHSNELDSRLDYGWYRDRFPTFILFVEPDVRLAAMHAKITNEELIDWINVNLR